MKLNILFAAATLFALFLFAGNCGKATDAIKEFFSKEPEAEAITKVYKTTVPLGYAASLAMAAANGDIANNVTVLKGLIDTAGCVLLTISIDKAHPLPMGRDTSGIIWVAGLWTSKKQAIFTMLFTHLDVGNGELKATKVSTFPASCDTNAVLVVYANEDVTIATGQDTLMTFSLTNQEIQRETNRLNTPAPVDSTMQLNQEAWILNVDENHTPAYANDDAYTITGAGQYIGASHSDISITQLVIIESPLGAACRKNPRKGLAILRTYEITAGDSASFPEIGTAFLTFHNTCDGKTTLTFATGVYIGTIGESFPLRLDE